IEGRIFDADDQPVSSGTPIARLESERFALQVARAKSEVASTQQNLRAAQTELEGSIPAQIAAAIASRTLAENDFKRSSSLINKNAASQGEVDRDRANFDNATAQVKQLEASQKAKEAEVESLKSAVEQAKQNLRDAERNLEDCTLYSSFTGQIADVSVVPGSVVSAGAPVVTMQMMDPIKVEMEVSAQQSRQMNRTEMYPVHVTMPDGSIEIHEGFLHQIDALADPLMRTYTLTFLVINRQLSMKRDPGLPTTKEIWRLDLPFLPGATEGRLFITEKAILHDDEGAYLWQATNATTGSRTPDDSIFEVRKIRVTPKDFKVPYLGNWLFQEVVVNDKEFDPQVNLVIGALEGTEGEPQDWNGDRVQVDPGAEWMLRPGDLVKVDLARSEGREGFYIPLNAVVREGSRSAIFVVSRDTQPKAKRIEVDLVQQRKDAPASSHVLVKPVGDVDLDGLPLIVRGTHYLVDGEPVTPVDSPESMPPAKSVTAAKSVSTAETAQ
ncbi:MAG: HlyD family efflux transporter periplasmic adaptor subunit, partial [Planctomycetota bacterium]